MQSYYSELLPPSGVEHAVSLNLTPATKDPSSSSTGKVLTNIVTARSNTLWVYELREEAAVLPDLVENERKRKLGGEKERRGTEAVEGEVAMDGGGEGYVSLGMVKSSDSRPHIPPTTRVLRLIRQHRLHGLVTGLGRVQTVATTAEDGLDRLIVSFKDAKLSILEWSDILHDLLTVSIHTYERSPQATSSTAHLHTPLLRLDPLNRCVSLLLPEDSLALIPFVQKDTTEGADIEVEVKEEDRGIPYTPSFILPFQSVDESIRNVIDYTFLEGFNNPTIAVLYQSLQTWTGRLKEHKDTTTLAIITISSLSPPTSSQSPDESNAIANNQNKKRYPVLSTTPHLPSDALSLSTIPGLGGLVILTSNSILYVEGSSKKVGLAGSGWAERVSDTSNLVKWTGGKDGGEGLMFEGSFVSFPTLPGVMGKGVLFHPSGAIYTLTLALEGRTVTGIEVSQTPIATGVIPALVVPISPAMVFVGGSAGASSLLAFGLEEKKEEHVNGVTENGNGTGIQEPEMDLDDDIYGSLALVPVAPNVNGASSAQPLNNQNATVTLQLLDNIPAYGPINDMCFGLTMNNQDKGAAELICATGSGDQGGLTFFQQVLPQRTKRKLHAVGGSGGIWELGLRQAPKTKVGTHELNTSCNKVIMSTDMNPQPGLSRVAARSIKSDVLITNRSSVITIGAASFFQGTAILQVTTNSVRLLETDGTERQVIKDMDGPLARARIISCSISDPFILVLREDNTLGLFIGESERGKVRRKDMSAMGEKSSRYVTASFFVDKSGLFKTVLNPSFVPTSASSKSKSAATSSLEAATDANRGTQWLILVRPLGVIEIWTLPKLALAFSTSILPLLPSVVGDSFDSPALSLPDDTPRPPLETDVEQIMVTSIGQSEDRPYLAILLRGGHIAMYEVIPVTLPPELPSTRELVLPIQLFRVCSYIIPPDEPAFDVDPQSASALKKNVLGPPPRVLHTFQTHVSHSNGPKKPFFGLFLAGDHPLWIIGSEKGGVKTYRCQSTAVYSFTASSMWAGDEEHSSAEFLMYTDEGPVLVEWLSEYQFDCALPYRSLPMGKTYSHVRYDVTTGLLAAVSALPSKFTLFDEEGTKLWEPDAVDVSGPTMHCSALELISPEDGYVLDGYEFAWNEFVNSLQVVTLETLSTDSGEKDFIACGTSVFRGEDLAVKGATYIFEIVEIVPDNEEDELPRQFKLRLLCKDESKGPVTAVGSINGYLVNSMGLKIFVRAFELDERLVGVAFLDVGMYVTTITVLKNLLLIGDGNRSVVFVAFQEDPFKLLIISRDTRPISTTSANFMYGGGEMGIVTRDDIGVLRIWGYEPMDLDSAGGQNLILASEFNTGVESQCTLSVIYRAEPILEDGDGMGAVDANGYGPSPDGDPQLKLLWGAMDGSLSSLTPVPTYSYAEMEMEMDVEGEGIGGTPADRYKRLHLLQGRLLRSLQHTAGLNPRAHRHVKSKTPASRLAKAVLDGSLLNVFLELGVERQEEICREIGAQRWDIIRDLISPGVTRW